MTRDDYLAKWTRQTKKALVEAVVAGDLSDETIVRIHRRYHRAMPLEQMRVGVEYCRKAQAVRMARHHEALHG